MQLSREEGGDIGIIHKIGMPNLSIKTGNERTGFVNASHFSLYSF